VGSPSLRPARVGRRRHPARSAEQIGPPAMAAASSVIRVQATDSELCVLPSHRAASPFAGRAPAGAVPGFFRTPHRRRSAALRGVPADSVPAIGPAADPRVGPAPIAARARAAPAAVARGQATAAPVRATEAHVRAGRADPAKAVRADRGRAAARAHRPGLHRAATAVTGRVPPVGPAEARADPPEVAGAASSSTPRRRDATALRRPRNPGRPAEVAAAAAGLSGSSPT
jgi:hypothetical protein